MAPPLVWPVVVLVAAILTSGIVWRLVLRYRPSVAATGWFGPFVLFGQALDVFPFVERVAGRPRVRRRSPPVGGARQRVAVRSRETRARRRAGHARPEFEFEEPPAQVRALLFVAGVAGLVSGASNLVLLAG